jgi:lipopolysaccharide transport system permease protein
MIYFGLSGAVIHPNAWLLLTPVLLLIMAALGLGGGIVISSLTTRYRDLQQLVGFGVQLLMYATPVIYPLSAVPENYRWIILINPMTPLIEAFRYASLGAGSINPAHLLYSVAVTVVILFLGILLFNHVERTFMDTV